jgi:hypothetical protein
VDVWVGAFAVVIKEAVCSHSGSIRSIVQHDLVRQVRFHEIPYVPELLLGQLPRDKLGCRLQEAGKQDFKKIQNAGLLQRRVGLRLPQARVHSGHRVGCHSQS